ncbi:MAG: hypothetical protein RL398_3393, partial [Planctomycetota bacterium]
LVLAALHHLLGLYERFAKHHTHNARMAAALLPGVPVTVGGKLSALHTGMAITTVTALLSMLLLVVGAAHAVPLTLCALASWYGLYLYERAYVQAGQLPPLS